DRIDVLGGALMEYQGSARETPPQRRRQGENRDAPPSTPAHVRPNLALIYIAAKLGCHRIGCCDRPNMLRGVPSLPMLEVMATSAISVLVGCALAVDGPNGLAFLVFLSLHVASWQTAKRLRA